jgi:hypothetical protein
MNLGAYIVHNYDLYFDATDKTNGSLYLAAERGTDAATIEQVIDRLRAVGIWSSESYKTVPDAQRQAYAEQMQFVGCTQFESNDTALLATRYTHPKYPSSAERYAQWLKVLVG